MKRSVRNGMFAAAVAAMLGFGGAQAFASPGAAAQGERVCTQPQCDESCRARGATGGQCVMGGCMCYVELPPAS